MTHTTIKRGRATLTVDAAHIAATIKELDRIDNKPHKIPARMLPSRKEPPREYPKPVSYKTTRDYIAKYAMLNSGVNLSNVVYITRDCAFADYDYTQPLVIVETIGD